MVGAPEVMDSNQKKRDGWFLLFVSGCGGLSLMSVMWCLFLVIIVMASFCSAVETTLEPPSVTVEASRLDTILGATADESDEMTSTISHDGSTPTTASSLRTTTAAGYNVDPSSHIYISKKSAARNDFIMVEMVRLVFNGNVQEAGFPNKVYGMLESFLRRATREVKSTVGSDWWFDLTSTLRPMRFENITFIDFRIKHTARKEISSVFRQLELRSFITQNSNLVLVTECLTSTNCQNDAEAATEISELSVVERNVSMFTTVVVLCSLCLVVMVTGMACSCLRRMKTSKPGKDKPTNSNGESQRVAVNQSSPVNVQASREAAEKTFFRSCPFGEEEDDDDVHSTWVIPLDKAPGIQGAVVVVTAQDTKL